MPKTKKAKVVSKADSTVHAEARERLMAAATELFAKHGLEGTSTRMIAQQSKLNISLISYYFGGKEALYKELIKTHALEAKKDLDAFSAWIASKALTREFFIESMRSLSSECLKRHLKCANMKMILFHEFSNGMPHSREFFDTVFYEIGEILKSHVKRAQKKNIVRKDINATAYVMMFIHAIDSYVMMSKSGTLCADECFVMPKDKDKLLDHVTKVLLEGGLTR